MTTVEREDANARPDVRVGIVSWNCSDELAACLAALPAALGSLRAEVVVVDNFSIDRSADVAESSPSVVCVRSPSNVGYARAMNRALAGTDATVLVALNPDTVPPPLSIEQLVRRLEARPGAGLLVPRLVNADGSMQHSVHRFPSAGALLAIGVLPPWAIPDAMRDRLWLHGREMPTHEVEIDWGTGAVHVIRRAALDGQPPYRERWFMYVEDLDLCWRLRQRGWHVLLTGDIEVTHIGNVSGRKAFGMTREARYWQATYDWVRLERGPLAARLAAMANTFAEGIRLVGSAISVAMRRRAKKSVARRWVTLRTHARAAVIGPRPPGHSSLADADDSRGFFVPPPGA